MESKQEFIDQVNLLLKGDLLGIESRLDNNSLVLSKTYDNTRDFVLKDENGKIIRTEYKKNRFKRIDAVNQLSTLLYKLTQNEIDENISSIEVKFQNTSNKGIIQVEIEIPEEIQADETNESIIYDTTYPII